MKQPSAYLKVRILGAVDTAEGETQRERLKNAARLTFTDEDGNPRVFTWRTIQSWLYRYKKHGITDMQNTSRSDKGKPRKITPEELLEAINSALPHFRDKGVQKMNIYRFCIEKGILSKNQISQTTFYRFVREYDLLTPNAKDNKKRLAFSMQYSNQLWQADTMFGPFVTDGKKHRQSKLIAFLDDASRVLPLNLQGIVPWWTQRWIFTSGMSRNAAASLADSFVLSFIVMFVKGKSNKIHDIWQDVSR